MTLYVCHSKNFDYQNSLYRPLKESNLPIEFIFPHENENSPFNSKELFQNKSVDFVLAEVSNPSTGQGIELGWANIFEIPIICFYKSGTNPTGSLNVITDKILEYSGSDDLVSKLMAELKLNIA